MRDLVKEYLTYLRVEKGLAKNSLEAYERDIKKLSDWCDKNGFEIEKLTRQDLREWLTDLGGKKLSQTTKLRNLSSVRGFYKFLAIEGYIKKNPAEDLDSPKKGFYLPEFLNRADIEKLLETPDSATFLGLRDRAIMELMYASGLRVSEAASITQREVDLESGILTCTGKGSKTRRVPVGKSALEWLGKYLAERRKIEKLETENLFVNSLGKKIDRQTIYNVIKKYAEQCGFENVSPHTIRHSFATHLVQNEADIRSVQQMLGHADISTTQIYTHITDAHLKKSYDKHHPRSRKS